MLLTSATHPMKMRPVLLPVFFAVLSCSPTVFAQNVPEVTLTLLGNDNIAEVNIEQESFIKSIGLLKDVTEKEFKNIDENQKVAILAVFHKAGKPTIEVYSNPEMPVEESAGFLKAVNSLKLENTKLVDFPILFTLNVKDTIDPGGFKGLVFPSDRVKKTYKDADLKQKYELNKQYAANEVLPVLGSFAAIVDDKFPGVKNFGKQVTETDFSKEADVKSMTDENYNYWRATLEMSIGNQLIPVTKIFMLISQGEFDYAMRYMEIISIFSDPKSIPDAYLEELMARLKIFNKELNAEIKKGVSEHDKGNYEQAIEVYNAVLGEYPNSAWANYELYFSQNALDVKNNKRTTADRSDWDKAKLKVYKNNPLYSLDIRANNGKEGYLLFRRQSISELFKKNEERITDVYKYADIAFDLGVYDFAAQLFWLSSVYDKDNKQALNKFLYCTEKTGAKDVKTIFKGDFEKEFKKIEKEKEKEMTESAFYKAFKN